MEKTHLKRTLSAGLLDSIIANAMDAIVTVDSAHKLVLFNGSAERMFGYDAAEVIGCDLGMLLPAKFDEDHRQFVKEFGKTRESRRRMGHFGIVHGVRKSGEEFPVEASISVGEDHDEMFFTAILRDVTERRRTEAVLREQVELLNHARDGIVVFTIHDEILFWNKSAERIFGHSSNESIGQNAEEFLCPGHPGMYSEAKAITLVEGEWFGEVSFTHGTTDKRVLESRWSIVHDGDENPVLILVICTDITEKKRFEAQFLRSQRLESIGVLAGGIAHDLNNILSPIMMSLALLQAKNQDQESANLLKTLLMMTERGGDMVKQILAFARGVEGEKITLSPRILVKEIVKMLRETFPRNITIRQELDENLDNVSGDITQLHQVLMNLAVNARDAMPEGGTLTFIAQNIDLDEQYARMNVDAEVGRFVMIQLIDSGCGIPDSEVHKIFDPFFTTKEKGKGTGLGLSTSVNIIRGHGGFINVYSEVGNGTRFGVYLPALSGTGEQKQTKAAEFPTGSGELILVVDDEPSIVDVTKQTLEAFGYRVVTAENGEEGVRRFKETDSVDLVLTDLMMPQMTGGELIREVLKIKPGTKIIACSGLESGNERESIHLGARFFLRKPFTAKTLLESIHNILKS